MNEINYCEVTCDLYRGVENLDDEDKLEMLGYDSVEELEEDGYNLSDLDFHFVECYDADFGEILEQYDLEILDEIEEGYYEGGCLFCRVKYKIKGKKEDIDEALKLWFVVDYDYIDLEKNWINEK